MHRDRSVDHIAVDVAIRLAFLGLFAYAALVLMRPFAPLVLWSVFLSVALYPAFEWLRDRLGGRARLAAGALTAFGLAVVLGPTTVLISSLVSSLEALARQFREGSALPLPPKVLGDIPVVGADLAEIWRQASSNLEGFFARYSHPLLGAGEWLLHVVERLGGSVLVILLAVLISGFLYVPGPRLVRAARLLAHRVVGDRGAGFVDLAGATIRNIARGVLGIATIQALLIGLGLIVAGVPAAGLLTLVALMLCILQVGLLPLTAALAVWGWFHYETLPALALTLYLIGCTAIDIPLKPMLLGKGLRTPALVILAGVIGGMIAYGLIGIFVGPIVLAVFYDLLTVWVAEDAPAGGVE